jgi:Tfp pilus assembly protein PilX
MQRGPEEGFVRHLVKPQDGVALPVASAMLLVISLFVIAVFSVALQLNNSSIKNRSSKRALAAAEAGLQAAVYRLNQIRPAALANECITNVRVVAAQCGTGLTEELGNGARYTYWVSRELGTTGTCVALPGVVPTVRDRCITSVGEVNGVTRRIQIRVLTQPSIPNFGDVGLVGKSLFYAWNSVQLTSDVGSNLRVELINSIGVNDDDAIDVDGRVLLLTGGTYNYQNSVTVDGGTHTTSTPFDMPLPDFEGPENANNNAVLPNSVFDGDRSLRRFRVSSGEVTIPPGTYHFCSFFLDNSVKLKFSHTGGVPTRIYVDSPSRPDSVCNHLGQSTTDGTFGVNNSVEVNKEDGEREELLDVYVYGTPLNDIRAPYLWCSDVQSPPQPNECRSDFMLDNSVLFYGNVYAPNSTAQAHNSVKIWGSVAADKIRFYNSVEFRLTGPARDERPSTPGAATRRGWAECRPEPAGPGAC